MECGGGDGRRREISVCCHLQPEMTPFHLFLQSLPFPPLVPWDGTGAGTFLCSKSQLPQLSPTWTSPPSYLRPHTRRSGLLPGLFLELMCGFWACLFTFFFFCLPLDFCEIIMAGCCRSVGLLREPTEIIMGMSLAQLWPHPSTGSHVPWLHPFLSLRSSLHLPLEPFRRDAALSDFWKLCVTLHLFFPHPTAPWRDTVFIIQWISLVVFCRVAVTLRADTVPLEHLASNRIPWPERLQRLTSYVWPWTQELIKEITYILYSEISPQKNSGRPVEIVRNYYLSRELGWMLISVISFLGHDALGTLVQDCGSFWTSDSQGIILI